MKKLDMAKAVDPLAKYAQRLNKSSVILTERGKPVAALVPIQNADWETVRLSTHPGFLALIERSRARQKREGGLTSREVRKRLGLKPTARAE